MSSHCSEMFPSNTAVRLERVFSPIYRMIWMLRDVEGLSTRETAEALGITPEKAARWRNRFLDGGLAALDKDAPRPGRPRTITAEKIQEVIRRTTQQTPAHATQWSTRSTARAVGVSEKSVRRIWRQHGLEPHLPGPNVQGEQ